MLRNWNKFVLQFLIILSSELLLILPLIWQKSQKLVQPPQAHTFTLERHPVNVAAQRANIDEFLPVQPRSGLYRDSTASINPGVYCAINSIYS